MEPVTSIALYISNRYKLEFNANIEEMKLHKLLYFAQRESLIQLDKPIFSEQFEAWRYGPVMVPVRNLYRYFDIMPFYFDFDYVLPMEYRTVMDVIFKHYAIKGAWSLSRLTHGEFSWQNARNGLGPVDSCSNPIKIEDIRKDADRVLLRRYYLEQQNCNQ